MKKSILFLLALATVVSAKTQPKPKFLWLDASANFGRLGTEAAVVQYMAKIAETGFTGVVVDLKPITGEVLYPSQIAPQIFEWKGSTREKDFDFAAVAVREAKRNKLAVYASMNVFSEGWKEFKRGVVYQSHPEWQTVHYSPDRLVKTTDYNFGFAVFVNPALPEVQEYEIRIMEEMLTKYDFDGIVLDRCRYDNLRSDFSDFSRQEFEKFAGKKVKDWPEDIFTWKKNDKDEWTTKPGKLYKEWLFWRATVIHDFFEKARTRVKATGKQFATYTGAWYSTYSELGVNWASSTYDPSEKYNWALPDYHKTGYAELLDFLFSGCYFYPVSVADIEKEKLNQKASNEEAIGPALIPEYTVEGSAKLAMKVTNGVTPLYGSLYVQQYKDKNNPEQFVRAIQMCLKETNGVMIFDLVHIDDFDWWDYVRKALQN